MHSAGLKVEGRGFLHKLEVAIAAQLQVDVAEQGVGLEEGG